MKQTVELIYYRIIQITTMYKGTDFETLKMHLLQNQKQDGYNVLNEWEYIREIEEAVLNLCKWGVLMWNHGYLFHCEFIAPGTELGGYLTDKEELYHRIYDGKRDRMERYDRLKLKEEVDDV